MNFLELGKLRRFLAEVRRDQVESLKRYFDSKSGGFRHMLELPKLSKASTATCVLSLIATGKWKEGPWFETKRKLVREIFRSPWRSAGLATNNVFTTAFLLETITVLGAELSSRRLSRVQDAEQRLLDSLSKGQEPGAAELLGYPPSAYLTQLVVRVLLLRGRLKGRVRKRVQLWASREINRQITLCGKKDKTADVYALAYSAITIASLASEAEATPEEENLLRTAMEVFFAAQLEDGSWPPSRPLFHYPGIGSAYCFEYEMLVQLLQQKRLYPILLEWLDKLRDSAYALKAVEFRLTGKARGWASGHHPQVPGPESWSTASVFHFVYVLDRLVAEAVRSAIFQHVDQEYRPPLKPTGKKADFARDFLDSAITFEKQRYSLRNTLWRNFIEPIVSNASEVDEGRALPRGIPVSAIFFGPPGTSKTDLAKAISESLGWPLLTIDPSHLVRAGMDKIQAEANTLFTMLEAAESIVVLFDEFDEMVRDRSSPATEANSRFLTTAMLPKLSSIHQGRKIVFILATNYIDQFDFAISRLGRFDKRFQIMPPTTQSKLRKWPKIGVLLNSILIPERSAVYEGIGLLSFSECERMIDQIDGADTRQEKLQIIRTEIEKCTLSQDAWLKQSVDQRAYVRL
jgi:hypothetical protein